MSRSSSVWLAWPSNARCTMSPSSLKALLFTQDPAPLIALRANEGALGNAGGMQDGDHIHRAAGMIVRYTDRAWVDEVAALLHGRAHRLAFAFLVQNSR
jgi:hypothetical protein